MESMGVVVRRYIDYLILLIPIYSSLSVLFYSSISTLCSFFKCFLFLYQYQLNFMYEIIIFRAV